MVGSAFGTDYDLVSYVYPKEFEVNIKLSLKDIFEITPNRI